ncbi:DsrE family protein [Acidihalobacter aeolianus]|nr:DsrE family protein [Acidihalobacter aeolianus]
MNTLKLRWQRLAVTLLFGFMLTAGTAAASSGPVDVHMLIMVDRTSPQSEMVAMNLIRHVIRFQGIDHAHLDLLAIGPGMKMLLKGTPYAEDIESFTDYGVKFVLCRRNLEAAHIPFSRRADDVGLVPDAVLEMQKRKNEGWMVVWP